MFDLLANNTDRKSGHVLIDGDDHIWGIDHGLCFAADFKLRTVVWEFGGEPIARGICSLPCGRIARRVPLEIAALLVRRRGRGASPSGRVGRRPIRCSRSTQSGRRYPWPLV